MDQIESLRAQVGAAIPSALRDADSERRGGVIAQLEQIAAQAEAVEPADLAWRALAAYLRACAALLRGEQPDPTGLLPEDRARLEGWQAERAALLEDDPIVAFAQTVAAWAASDEDDAGRAAALPGLAEAAAGLTVEALRLDDADAREALAAALLPLRDTLRLWPPAAQLPPYNALLGCLQALLRGAPEALERMRARLDGPLAAMLAEVERLVAADEAALHSEARDRQIADLRRQVDQAMRQATQLPRDDPRRAELLAQLEHLAAQAAADEPAGSPWLDLAAHLRSCAAALAAGRDQADR
ncbi:MAG TPA: hypothetical protein VFS21_26320 [Roseiflexaceae bacterium]|nr:hypothetical protein [Roseiflexaceae bacterium]